MESPVGPIPVTDSHCGESDNQAGWVRVSSCSCHCDQNAGKIKFKEGRIYLGSWFQIHHSMMGMVGLVRQKGEESDPDLVPSCCPCLDAATVCLLILRAF